MRTCPGNRREEFVSTDEYLENGSKYCHTTISISSRELTSLTRRDPNVDTVWTLEHLLKDVKDLEAYLALPNEVFACSADASKLLETERQVGDRGIVMVDTMDSCARPPSCSAWRTTWSSP